MLIISSSEKVLLKPFSFQTWLLLDQRRLRCPDSTCMHSRGRPGISTRYGTWMMSSSTFPFRIKHDIFYRFSLSGIFSKFQLEKSSFNKLSVPYLNLIWWHMLDLSIRLTLDCTLNAEQVWFSILAFELHFVHDT